MIGRMREGCAGGHAGASETSCGSGGNSSGSTSSSIRGSSSSMSNSSTDSSSSNSSSNSTINSGSNTNCNSSRNRGVNRESLRSINVFDQPRTAWSIFNRPVNSDHETPQRGDPNAMEVDEEGVVRLPSSRLQSLFGCGRSGVGVSVQSASRLLSSTESIFSSSWSDSSLLPPTYPTGFSSADLDSSLLSSFPDLTRQNTTTASSTTTLSSAFAGASPSFLRHRNTSQFTDSNPFLVVASTSQLFTDSTPSTPAVAPPLFSRPRRLAVRRSTRQPGAATSVSQSVSSSPTNTPPSISSIFAYSQSIPTVVSSSSTELSPPSLPQVTFSLYPNIPRSPPPSLFPTVTGITRQTSTSPIAPPAHPCPHSQPSTEATRTTALPPSLQRLLHRLKQSGEEGEWDVDGSNRAEDVLTPKQNMLVLIMGLSGWLFTMYWMRGAVVSVGVFLVVWSFIRSSSFQDWMSDMRNDPMMAIERTLQAATDMFVHFWACRPFSWGGHQDAMDNAVVRSPNSSSSGSMRWPWGQRRRRNRGYMDKPPFYVRQLDDDEDVIKNLLDRKELTRFECPITHELFVEPVVAADGFTYERVAIEAWIAGGGESNSVVQRTRERRGRGGRGLLDGVEAGNSLSWSSSEEEEEMVVRVSSPMTGCMLSHLWLLPNHTLKAFIVQYLQLRKEDR
eukprot:GHVQ01017576.1.p1 GENE.GHVQ01017576.1~~GHVQ01017576.1.p1  ORF type:complete len:674 (-),score=132.04 GHVQ01017576.1:322-2343(-)